MLEPLNLFDTKAEPRRNKGMLNKEELFYALLHAETEDAVDEILKDSGMWEFNPTKWIPYGGKEHSNNFGQITTQHSEATGALVEKIVNAIDAVLMRECWKSGMDPVSTDAPASMADAAELFFKIKGGRLENVLRLDIQDLADNIHLVAVGSRQEPNYLIVDQGEGQTPAMIPETICSLSKSNKVNIQFVQGKYNSGGAGVLPFCGSRNYQLIVTKRCPSAPSSEKDETRELWGFTLVRLKLPGENEKNPSYVYYAPDGNVPTFRAKSIKVLPADVKPDKPLRPYSRDLEYGTCIKLYSYKWRKKALRGLITLDTRYELDRYLHSPCLPFYISETRDYTAHSLKTPFKGLSATLVDKREDIQDGFPDSGYLRIPGIGKLNLRVLVFKHLDKKGKILRADSESRKRAGIFFLVNGQTHYQVGPEFITRKVGFSHAGKFALVTVDCADMDKALLPFFFMASRDRTRGIREYDMVMSELKEYLRKHEGLRAIDNKIHSEQVAAATSEDQPVKILETLISRERAFADLLPAGLKIRTPFSNGEQEKKPELKRFPTYFRISKEPTSGLEKPCPVNNWCRVVFETDVVNDYFTRADMPGSIDYYPEGISIGDGPLWEGKYPVRFKPPRGAKEGDIIPVTVTIRDERIIEPVVNKFDLVIIKPEKKRDRPVTGYSPRRSKMGQAGLPDIHEIKKDAWETMDPAFEEFTALRLDGGVDDKPLEFWVNMDNIHLLNFCKNERTEDGVKHAKFAFKYGLFLTALAQFRELQQLRKRKTTNNICDSIFDDYSINELIELNMIGHARVIIPLVRQLSKGADIIADN